VKKPVRKDRAFGRQYVVRWDTEVRRFHVSLGAESIGFHKTREGAAALATAHAQCVALPERQASFAIATLDDEDTLARD
jgi:hypothetical protein